MEGIGFYEWKNDNQYYLGEYLSNRKVGYGIYKFTDGTLYIGQWFNDK